MECKNTNGQIVVPVFYQINPAQVRHQTGTYADAFAKHEERLQGTQNHNKIQTWRHALSQAANISAWDCSAARSESELVEKIAMDVLQKLESINGGGIERRIATCKEKAQEKLNKFLRSGEIKDMEELISTMHQLADVKLEKALNSDDSSVWEDLLGTYERLLQLKRDKWEHSQDERDYEDYCATQKHVKHLQREYSNRQHGFWGI
ncbi:hypothetical protein PIB30_006793 [Stylosanthes scabra]|uniref:TIR domain-containing protein n=1 Tax=Stylosanthes scabra TaxID=79078 RepID=A0ABU6U666_9FABA|nr:hypothetical protein [Stylosanthes scabra]